MTTSTAAKKQFILYFALPFIFFLAIYGVIFSMINRHWGQPNLTVSTLAKYTFSRIFDFANFDFLRFDVPSEYAGYITASGYAGTDIQARFYHSLLDFLPLNTAYFFFPYFLFLAAMISFFIMVRHPVEAEKKLKRDKYIRGARKISAEDFCKKSQKDVLDPGIILHTKNGKLILSTAKEKEHTIILGSTGSGKSTLLISMVSQFLHRNTRMIFVDRKGEFYSKFGDKSKDVLFNPFDARSVRWSIFNEINFELDPVGNLTKMPIDLLTIADILLGVNDPKKARNKFWYTSASSVLCSSVCWCAINHKTTNSDLVDFITSPADIIISAFKSLPKPLQAGLGALGNSPDSEMVGSILSTLNSAARQLACFDMDGDFSFRKWINDDAAGNLYLSTAGRDDTSFNSIVSLGVDLIGREIKQFVDNGDQETRIVFLIDELSAFPVLDTLTFLLTQARSKGVAMILANQTFSKIRELYGQESAKNIFSCTKSRFFFQLPEADDAQYVAKTLGQAEVERTLKSTNESHGALLSTGQARSGENESRQIVRDDSFLPANITGLQTGQAIVMLPNLLPDLAQLDFLREDHPTINPEFEPIKKYEVSAKAFSHIVDAAATPQQQPQKAAAAADSPRSQLPPPSAPKTAKDTPLAPTTFTRF